MKMENDNISAGAALGSLGAGAYAFKKNKDAKSIAAMIARRHAKRSLVQGALVGAITNGNQEQILNSMANKAALFGTLGAFSGRRIGNKAKKILLNKRNAALAAAGLLGALAIGTKEK